MISFNSEGLFLFMMHPAQELLGLVRCPEGAVGAHVGADLGIRVVSFGQVGRGRGPLGRVGRDDVEDLAALVLVGFRHGQQAGARRRRGAHPAPQLLDARGHPVLVVLLQHILAGRHLVDPHAGHLHPREPVREGPASRLGLGLGQGVGVGGANRVGLLVDGEVGEPQGLVRVRQPDGVDAARIAEALDSLLGRRPQAVKGRVHVVVVHVAVGLALGVRDRRQVDHGVAALEGGHRRVVVGRRVRRPHLRVGRLAVVVLGRAVDLHRGVALLGAQLHDFAADGAAGACDGDLHSDRGGGGKGAAVMRGKGR